MKKLIALIVCLLLMPLGHSLAEDSSLDDALAKVLKAHKATGAALYVAKDGEIVYEYLYGYADKKAGIVISEDTYFRTASVTKMISGIHTMQLVEQGLLDLDENIGVYFGYSVTNPYAGNAPVTLRQLMSHTSSLSSSGGYTKSNRTLSSLLNDATKQWNNFHKYAPGSKYEYSNFGAGIMGSLMEAVTGLNLNDSVTAGLFDPLGIDAGYHQTLVDIPENITAQYATDMTLRRTRSLLLSQTWDNSVDPENHYRSTVGAVWMKGRDLCRIGMLLCQGGTLDGVTILQPETVALMLSDQNGQPGITCSSPYGLCVHRVTNLVKGRMVYGHQGMSNGLVCNVYFDPETQFVFALVTNGSSDSMNDHICKISRKTFNLCWQAFSGTEDEVIF
ncbi:MAG: serine hydrolase domain-containing protein [Aristaeellaceae bacterium]